MQLQTPAMVGSPAGASSKGPPLMPIRRRFAAQSGQILTMSALWAALCGLAACGTTGPAAASSPAASNAPQSESPTPAPVPQQQMTALTAATGAVNPVGAGLAAAVPARVTAAWVAPAKVVDTKPQTFVSVGMQGFYGIDNVRRGIAKLNEWLAANPQWEAVGDPRSLYYNGPERANRDKWLEVQLPVRQRNASSDDAPK